ncbi:MAG: AAA family ATPase [Candidatus Eisenbacteria bacterium]|uniref:AAA family ATPase n=1 Tax=Eiseniibacteriota bacterium TaxID=2212470 RepID=A0A948RSG3_UNCEI|nr:AAA family ATPase [Candidatus Eisenbacteria bacterium]MBU1949106.1 AAA family ATPase [Candidatus Eisenbacteria bacterium]MBU2689766.1 AAA family ATPase [Candidatus Eisenbacteria bacterium]
MVEVTRTLDLNALLQKKSHFLFGPRQTGKTFLIRRSLADARIFDLLDSSVFLALSNNPGRLEEEISPKDSVIVIDEIQRLPELLNEVHRLIESRGLRFLLTGSSARKLRRGGVNLLGGRVRTKFLHPLTYQELGDRFDLLKMASRGLLPSIYFSDDPAADLEAYVGSYLQQEIAAEGATRNVPAFSRFLRIAALCNATIVNYTKVANDAQVARTTVYDYFDILRDTLIVHELPAWKKSLKRKPIVSSKYYFFDVGVVASLQGRAFRIGTPEFGEAFETYIFHELRCQRDSVSGEILSYWRSTSGFEVDFIIGDHTAIEAKAKKNITSDDLRGLRALSEEKKLKQMICVSLEPRVRQVGGIRILPWQVFLDELWKGKLERR